MENIESKYNRIVADSDKLIELYDFAEKIYPYSKIRNQVTVTSSTHLSLSLMKMKTEEIKLQWPPMEMVPSISMVLDFGVSFQY